MRKLGIKPVSAAHKINAFLSTLSLRPGIRNSNRNTTAARGRPEEP